MGNTGESPQWEKLVTNDGRETARQRAEKPKTLCTKTGDESVELGLDF